MEGFRRASHIYNSYYVMRPISLWSNDHFKEMLMYCLYLQLLYSLQDQIKVKRPTGNSNPKMCNQWVNNLQHKPLCILWKFLRISRIFSGLKSLIFKIKRLVLIYVGTSWKPCKPSKVISKFLKGTITEIQKCYPQAV